MQEFQWFWLSETLFELIPKICNFIEVFPSKVWNVLFFEFVLKEMRNRQKGIPGSPYFWKYVSFALINTRKKKNLLNGKIRHMWVLWFTSLDKISHSLPLKKWIWFSSQITGRTFFRYGWLTSDVVWVLTALWNAFCYRSFFITWYLLLKISGVEC